MIFKGCEKSHLRQKKEIKKRNIVPGIQPFQRGEARPC